MRLELPNLLRAPFSHLLNGSNYRTRASWVVLVVKNLPANAGDEEPQVRSLGWEDALEEGVTTDSSILA